jgi:hypothetical protein
MSDLAIIYDYPIPDLSYVISRAIDAGFILVDVQYKELYGPRICTFARPDGLIWVARYKNAGHSRSTLFFNWKPHNPNNHFFFLLDFDGQFVDPNDMDDHEYRRMLYNTNSLSSRIHYIDQRKERLIACGGIMLYNEPVNETIDTLTEHGIFVNPWICSKRFDRDYDATSYNMFGLNPKIEWPTWVSAICGKTVGW